MKVGNSEAFKAVGATPQIAILPPCKHLEYPSYAYWECHVRHLPYTIYHDVGTCRMGPHNDPSAVVDPELRYVVQLAKSYASPRSRYKPW